MGRNRMPVGKTITALLVVNLVLLVGFPVLLGARSTNPCFS